MCADNSVEIFSFEEEPERNVGSKEDFYLITDGF